MAACSAIDAIIPAEGTLRADAIASLVADLAALPKAGFSEVWVHQGYMPALCALLNGERGWLMFVRYDGDPGFSSRNPNYAGAPDAEIEYMLSNGQIDCCPAQWAYPRDQVLKALDSFARTGRVEGIAWSNDSGDGARDPHKRASWDD